MSQSDRIFVPPVTALRSPPLSRMTGALSPVIALSFMSYALWGPAFPGLLQHSGASWPNIVNHLYLTSQGIYGIAVGVVNLVAQDGESNWLEGALLLAVYLVLGIAFFFLP